MNSILDLIGNTPILKLSTFDTGLCDLYVKLECQNPGGSIKDRIGLSIIEEAEKSGNLKPGGTIIEATAGNTGIGLALVAALKGYKIILVIPDKMSREKILHLEGLGAEIILTRSDVAIGHPEYYQDLAKKIAEETPDSFIADQFSNPANPLAHETTTGPEIWNQMEGRLDAVVAGVGSGGTLTGLAEFLKVKDNSIQMVVADPEGSVIADAVKNGNFKYEGGSWLVEGIGEDFIPPNLNLNKLDDAVTVSDLDAFTTLNKLLVNEGILGGSSSGTLLAGAIKWCQKQTSPKRVVTFICDTGNKYLSKAFNQSWLFDNNLTNKKAHGNLLDLINRRADLNQMLSVSPSDTLLIAYNRMRSLDVSQLPVLRDSQIVGIVDEEDLLFSLEGNKNNFQTKVESFMVTQLESFQVNEKEQSIIPILKQGKVAIIMDNDIFLGFITKVDLINRYRSKMRPD